LKGGESGGVPEKTQHQNKYFFLLLLGGGGEKKGGETRGVPMPITGDPCYFCRGEIKEGDMSRFNPAVGASGGLKKSHNIKINKHNFFLQLTRTVIIRQRRLSSHLLLLLPPLRIRTLALVMTAATKRRKRGTRKRRVCRRKSVTFATEK
jgi:hypothetical protein